MDNIPDASSQVAGRWKSTFLKSQVDFEKLPFCGRQVPSNGKSDSFQKLLLRLRENKAGPHYLTECIYKSVLASQLPHQIVNLLITITN